ncbi:MAG: hypothetical protein AAB548_03135 [Patescibacteria group bacterium]
MARLEAGGVIYIAPEGHVEVNNSISPIETFHAGTGRMAMRASAIGVSVVPVGIWEQEDRKRIHVQVGGPFVIEGVSSIGAVRELMERIADELPEQFRGPFA